MGSCAIQMFIISSVTCRFYAVLSLLNELYRHLCFIMQEYKVFKRKIAMFYIFSIKLLYTIEAYLIWKMLTIFRQQPFFQSLLWPATFSQLKFLLKDFQTLPSSTDMHCHKYQWPVIQGSQEDGNRIYIVNSSISGTVSRADYKYFSQTSNDFMNYRVFPVSHQSRFLKFLFEIRQKIPFAFPCTLLQKVTRLQKPCLQKVSRITKGFTRDGLKDKRWFRSSCEDKSHILLYMFWNMYFLDSSLTQK